MSSLLPLLVALSIASAGPTDPVLVLDAPELMQELEKHGVSLASRLGAPGAKDTATLTQKSSWAGVVKVLGDDLDSIMRSDDRAGPGLKYAHRLFDKDWINSDDSTFELVAVVNRLDRQIFEPNHCGEVRLVYRLSYTRQIKQTTVRSRLPMTVNLVLWQRKPVEEEDCVTTAKRWFRLAQENDVTAIRSQLLKDDGILGPQTLSWANMKSIEVNVQSVRWPSTVHPSLAGHAEYIMRVFKTSSGKLVESHLENTPDVRLLKSKRGLKKELLKWLKEPENMKAIDLGTVVIPERFLATEISSVAPRGLARLANRPFRQLFSAKDFKDIDFSGHRFVKSPRALLRRLDSRSCGGCHQSRSTAGFHMLGRDPTDMKVDALAHGHSEHFQQDLARRLDFSREMLTGYVDSARGFPERLERVGVYGSRCGLGDKGFARWGCSEGLTCKELDDSELGVCLPSSKPQIGDPCAVGTMKTKAEGHRDRVRDVKETSCGPKRLCESNPVGFPNGMCAGPCDADDPQAVCGSIAVLSPFNRCLGRKNPFPQCIVENVRPAALRRCDAAHPCRDDYICARTPEGKGACIPPYFLFQLRVDGH